MNFLKKYDLLFVFGVSLIISISLLQFEKTKELGTNLLTEITGVAVTVFVINKILERKERKKRISIDQRILREVQSIIASYFSIWKHLVWQYFPNKRIENESDFLALYPQLVSLSRMSEQFKLVSIHHPESWKLFFHNRSIKDCFKNYYDTLNNEILLFINDFKMYLEPELLDFLLDIMEGEYFKNIYMMCYSEGTEKTLVELGQDVNKLDAYFNPDEPRHVHQFLQLIDYSRRLKRTITKFTPTDIELYLIREYFIYPSQLYGEVGDKG